MRENDRYGVKLRRPKVERVFVVSSNESRHREQCIPYLLPLHVPL
jgi:hypothetical protein